MFAKSGKVKVIRSIGLIFFLTPLIAQGFVSKDEMLKICKISSYAIEPENFNAQLKTCSEQSLKLQSACYKELCGKYEEVYPAPRSELTIYEKKFEALKFGLTNIFNGNVKNFKNYLESVARNVNTAVANQSKRINSPDYNFEANFSVSISTCDNLKCTNYIKEMQKHFDTAVKFVEGDYNAILLKAETNAEQKSELIKLIGSFIKNYPKAYQISKNSTDNNLKEIDKFTPEQIRSLILSYLVYGKMKENQTLLKSMEQSPPSLETVWGENLKPLQISAKRFELLKERCIANLSERLAYLPTQSEVEKFNKSEVPKARKSVIEQLKLNFKGPCADIVEQKLPKDIPTTFRTRELVEQDIVNWLINYSGIKLSDLQEQIIFAYTPDRVKWFEHACYDVSLMNIELEHDSALHTDKFDLNQRVINLSSQVLRRKSANTINHELGHWIQYLMNDTPECKESLKNTKACLNRKNTFGDRKKYISDRGKEEISEDFADLFGAGADKGGFCEFYSDRKFSTDFANFDFIDNWGHGSFIFRELAISSLKNKKIPNQCQKFLDFYGQGKLFDEKCIKLPEPKLNELRTEGSSGAEGNSVPSEQNAK